MIKPVSGKSAIFTVEKLITNNVKSKSFVKKSTKKFSSTSRR